MTGDHWAWSWALTLMGCTCFILAGRKVWWSWYVGLATQVLWAAYAVLTQQWGFLVGVPLYGATYVTNAVAWTREHRRAAAADGDAEHVPYGA